MFVTNMISIIDAIRKKKRKTKKINVNSQMVKMRIQMIYTIEKIDRLMTL
jgi:hypothetical protein